MILIFLDDVMRSRNNAALYEGLALYRLFKESVKVTILAKDKKEAERWCGQNNLLKVDDIVDYNNVNYALEDKDFEMVKYCRARGTVQLVITGDTDLAKKLLEEGIHSLLFLHPVYLRHEFRPDSRQGVKSWNSISEEYDKQVEMLSQDPRT